MTAEFNDLKNSLCIAFNKLDEVFIIQIYDTERLKILIFCNQKLKMKRYSDHKIKQRLHVVLTYYVRVTKDFTLKNGKKEHWNIDPRACNKTMFEMEKLTSSKEINF